MARTEAVCEVFLWCFFLMAFCLVVFRPPSVAQSVNPLVRPRQSTRLPSVPVQAQLACRLFGFCVLDGTMFPTASLWLVRRGRLAPRTGFERSHKSRALDLLRPVENGQIAFLLVRRVLKGVHGA